MKELLDNFDFAKTEIISIDIGLHGAICFVENDNFYIMQMPVIKNEKNNKNWYNVDKLVEVLKKANKTAKVFIELQRPMSKQGVISVFTLGRGFGIIEGISRTLFNSITILDPKTWQNFLYKKYLDKDINKNFNSIYPLLIKDIEEPYKSLYDKKINTKSLKVTKIKTFYCLYKSGYIDSFNTSTLKNTDKMDAFMISLYGRMGENG